MSSLDDQDYYQRRAAEEQKAAREANDDCARRAHIDMAEQYEKRAREGYFEDRPRGPALFPSFR